MTAAFLIDRPGFAPEFRSPAVRAGEFLHLFGLDRLPAERRLVCHWRRGADGRLVCAWEPDIGPVPHLHP